MGGETHWQGDTLIDLLGKVQGREAPCSSGFGEVVKPRKSSQWSDVGLTHDKQVGVIQLNKVRRAVQERLLCVQMSEVRLVTGEAKWPGTGIFSQCRLHRWECSLSSG